MEKCPVVIVLRVRGMKESRAGSWRQEWAFEVQGTEVGILFRDICRLNVL